MFGESSRLKFHKADNAQAMTHVHSSTLHLFSCNSRCRALGLLSSLMGHIVTDLFGAVAFNEYSLQ